MIIFSRILWKSLPALGFEAEPVTSAWNAESGAQARYKQRSCPVLKLPETSPSGRGAPLEPSTPSKTKVRLLSLQFTGKFSIACSPLVSQMGGKRPFGKLLLIEWLKGNLLLFGQGYSIRMHTWESVIYRTAGAYSLIITLLRKTVGKETGKVENFSVNTPINVKLAKPDILIVFLTCCSSPRSQIQNREYNLYA